MTNITINGVPVDIRPGTQYTGKFPGVLIEEVDNLGTAEMIAGVKDGYGSAGIFTVSVRKIGNDWYYNGLKV